MTARDALREGAAALAGTETPFLDASLLLADALSIDSARLLAAGPDPIAEAPLGRYRAGLAARSRGVPVAYILGRKEFWGRVFSVDERVLVPRPDTETLVAEALRLGDIVGRGLEPETRLRVHEACCGSGCVAISVALDRLEWAVSASDVSEDALGVARANAEDLVPRERIGGAVSFVRSDLLSGVRLPAADESVAVVDGRLSDGAAASGERAGGFDLILANPPYVPTAEAKALLSLGWSEPLLALDGGDDGLDLVRALAPQAYRALAPGGAFLVEADGSQAPLVAELLRATRFSDIETRYDLGGKARVTSGRKAWTT